ncbi:alpha/beta hydrolase fold domain-containing protein [Arcanobacterium buesumense]|uniref:Alpha/beta hydrolase fold domain-containing protein n=1 Tax=Arcanobacterium buesumense TaxID=2722751 RepID=A0A6H2ELH4_9ACTO|nr:alpha/beta hydrolase fold domain-containing protein [Arcanobacterium buesumense]QJC21925.1 alpha/beta hydrolase fold domain-containing protein [Arcanobacterium buesumense]
MHEAMKKVQRRKADIRENLALPKNTLAQIRDGYLQKRVWWNDGGPQVSRSSIKIGPNNVDVSLYGSHYSSTHAIVYAHGGGWIVGHSQSHDRLLRTLSSECCCPVFSVNYSLAPESKYPTQVCEVADVISYLASRVSHIFLMGDSCGATLMVQTFHALSGDFAVDNLQPNLASASQIAGLGFFYGGYGLVDSPSLRQYSHVAGMTRADLASYEKAIIPAGGDRRVLDMLNVDAQRYPAVYLLSAQIDPLRDDSRALATKIQGVSGNVVYNEIPGVQHEFMQYGRMLPQVAEVIKNVAHWLNANTPHEK